MKKIFTRTVIVLILLFYLFIGHELFKTFQYTYDCNGESITLNNYVEYRNIRSLLNNYPGKRDLMIPSYIIGKPVRSLNWTFVDYPLLKSVKLPNTVITVGDHVFNGCSLLTDVSLSPNLESIGDSAFSKCQNLKTLVLPSKVESIGQFAFSSCKKLEAINLPNKLLVIEEGTFLGCDSLKEIAMPDSTVTIRNSAFQECPDLIRVYIPNSVIEMEPDIFKDSPLVEIITPSGSTAEKYAIENKIPYRIQP